MSKEKVPVSIITGFLGVGKTTLINKIVEKEGHKDFVLIENEFSDLPIDGELIAGISGNRVFELANGCICCTLDTELQETLLQLSKTDLNFNHLLIETTGIAEPEAIVQNLIANDELKELFFIDSICCIVDAQNFETNLKEKESINQLTVADIVILNKTEKAETEELELIANRIRILNPVCEIVPVCYGEYGEHQIIDKYFFNENSFNKTFNEVQIHTHSHDYKEHHHHEILTESFLLKGSFDMEKFSMWMDYFLHINQNSIIRVKGLLSFEGISRKMIFQAVKSAYTLEEGNFWQNNEERTNKIIFIGRKMDKESIREGIESLIC